MDIDPKPSEGVGFNCAEYHMKIFPMGNRKLLCVLSELGVCIYIHSPYDKE